MDTSEFTDKVLKGDCLTVLPTLPEKCVHSVITSPPYFGLRSYKGILPTSWPEVIYSLFGFPITIPAGTCELGHETDPKQFIGHMLLIFREIKRVLRDDGTAWVNMGDSYAGSNKGTGDVTISKQTTNRGSREGNIEKNITPLYMKPKDMMGIPWMLAFALREDGWYLRSDIIWSKPNPMPESVTDRPTKSHEYFFLLAKSERYYYDADAIKTEPKYPGVKKYAWGRAIDGSLSDNRKGKGEEIRKMKALENGQKNIRKARDKQRGHSKEEQMSMGANKRTVWEIATHSFPDAHFATFPEDLVVDPIKAGCPEGGTILDPFSGAGTTFIVGKKLNRHVIAIEISEVYVPMSEKRVKKELGMFSPI